MIHVELPHPPGAFVGPLTIGTYVNHQQEQLDERLIARPHEATLTLRAYSREPGGRISGSLELLNEGKIGGQSHR
jgi:hypothetical protein